jgi:hypothetical protein
VGCPRVGRGDPEPELKVGKNGRSPLPNKAELQKAALVWAPAAAGGAGGGTRAAGGWWRAAGGAPGKMGAGVGSARRRQVLHQKGRFPRNEFKFYLGEKLVEVRNRDVDRRVPLSLEPHHPTAQLIMAHDEGCAMARYCTSRTCIVSSSTSRVADSRRKVPNATVQGQ